MFKECDNCPEMVVVPAGRFSMGSPVGEKHRNVNEGPQHTVTIGKPFAVGKFHVTVDQFAAFVAETDYDAGSNCLTFEGEYGSWRSPGFPQEGLHPVVCLSWTDARAYVDWIARKTGKPYRLLTEAEWEYAARARTEPGSYPRYWFGDEEKDLCRYGNVHDQKMKYTMQSTLTNNMTFAPCNNHTSAVGSFTANDFGLYEMAGNAYEWTQDCAHENYDGAPTDGSAWTSGNCDRRIVRGGSWGTPLEYLRAAFRYANLAYLRDNGLSFRVARMLMP